jgi:hypothetical protein
MPSTNRTTTLTRSSQVLAAAALIAGLAFGAAPIAGAAWDQGSMDKCMAKSSEYTWDVKWDICCTLAGGTALYGANGVMNTCRHNDPGPAQGPGAPTAGKPPGAPPPVDAEQGPGAPIGAVPLAPTDRG